MDIHLAIFIFRASATKLIDSLTSFSRTAERDYPENYEGKMLNKFGLQLCQGLKAFAEQDYDTALNLLRPIRTDWNQSLSGSRAQIDVLNQVLIHSAIKSGNKTCAKQLLKERWATCGVQNSDEPSTNLRLHEKIQAMI